MMAYNREIEQTIVISKPQHDKLKKLAEADKRTLKSYTDLLIDQTYTQTFSKSTNKAS